MWGSSSLNPHLSQTFYIENFHYFCLFYLIFFGFYTTPLSCFHFGYSVSARKREPKRMYPPLPINCCTVLYCTCLGTRRGIPRCIPRRRRQTSSWPGRPPPSHNKWSMVMWRSRSDSEYWPKQIPGQASKIDRIWSRPDFWHLKCKPLYWINFFFLQLCCLIST